MSHLTKVELTIKNRERLIAEATKLGMTSEVQADWKGQFNQSAKNALVIKQGSKVKMVVGEKGEVLTDPYYMGREHEQLLQNYAAAHIRHTAMLDGGCVTNKGVDKNGNLVLEVNYA